MIWSPSVPSDLREAAGGAAKVYALEQFFLPSRADHTTWLISSQELLPWYPCLHRWCAHVCVTVHWLHAMHGGNHRGLQACLQLAEKFRVVLNSTKDSLVHIGLFKEPGLSLTKGEWESLCSVTVDFARRLVIKKDSFAPTPPERLQTHLFHSF